LLGLMGHIFGEFLEKFDKNSPAIFAGC